MAQEVTPKKWEKRYWIYLLLFFATFIFDLTNTQTITGRVVLTLLVEKAFNALVIALIIELIYRKAILKKNPPQSKT